MSYFFNHGDAALYNEYFRKEVFTSDKSQITYMKLQVNEDAGESVHDACDHVIFCVQGTGKVILDGSDQTLAQGDIVAVPRGTRHQIVNGTSGSMRLVCMYTPALYPRGTVHETRVEGDAAH